MNGRAWVLEAIAAALCAAFLVAAVVGRLYG